MAGESITKVSRLEKLRRINISQNLEVGNIVKPRSNTPSEISIESNRPILRPVNPPKIELTRGSQLLEE